MTERKRYQRYSPEFKREALKRAAEEGASDKSVCAELGVSLRQLRRWRDELRRGHSHNEEITKLKREVSKLRQERDFLKDAVVFFAKESN